MHSQSTQQQHTKGQSLIEVLFGLALAVLAISTIGYLFLNTQTSAVAIQEHLRALGLAHEGIAAAAALAQEDFRTLSGGTYGIKREHSGWQLSENADQTEKYDRSVTVRKLDPAVIEVTSSMSWPLYAGREGNVSLSSVVTNWRQNEGSAGLIGIEGAAQFSDDGMSIMGIELLTTETAFATAVTLSWDGTAELLSLAIAGTEVFNASGTAPLSSDTRIAFDPLDIDVGYRAFGALTFNEDMRSVPLMAALELGDGSVRYFRITQ